jgi:hypothetical protein
MHVYVAKEFQGEIEESEEGLLQWKSSSWIRDTKDVVSNIPIFLDHL